MATYNIPGITTSVIDYSVVKPVLKGGRTPLIIGPSKFGDDENLMEFSNADDLKYFTGGANYNKYGLSLIYALGALTVTGSILFKRLTASDSRYANISILKNNNNDIISGSKNDSIDKKYFYNNNIINHFGKAKGEGYNDFYLTYERDQMTEKIYADDEGESKYNFNFLKTTIYQQTPNGVKNIAGPFTISLIDNDPKTSTPIIDVTTGSTLYINDKIETSNKFVNVKFNEEYLPEVKKYSSLEDVLTDKNTPELLLKDINTGINYKVKADSELNLYPTATALEGQDRIILKYYSSGAWNYVKLYIEDGEIKNESTTDVTADDSTYENLYALGADEYVRIYIDSDSQELTVKEFETFRSLIYKKLLSKTWQLENGYDGQNVHINNQMNFNGPGENSKENIKQLLMDYINTDEKIKEVMYPEYNFAYIVDWTCDLDVINSIISLTDDTGTFMGIFSLPLSYDPNIDYKMRTDKLYQSTYNNALYSGEWNLNHFEENSGKSIVMPMSYYMMIDHLKIDNELSITEPVAGIIKGQMPISSMKLSYIPKSRDIEKLRNVQINTITKETDGIYSIDQLTLYKKASKLSRINVVKVIHQMRRDLPQLLKKYIQTKETNDVVSSVNSDVTEYMNKWAKQSGTVNPDEIFKSININTIFLDSEYKLIVSIRVSPIGTIENIDIPIIVEKK